LLGSCHIFAADLGNYPHFTPIDAMNLLKSHARKSVLVGLLFFVFHISATAQNGEQLF